MLKNLSPSARTWLRFSIPFLLIPICLFIGFTVLDERQHLFLSLTVATLSVLLFLTGIESKTVGTRRMVIVSVMTALCIVGRFIPLFKPITALTVMTALYLGPESGFLVGAMASLLSNFYFGQGPWTPFQMLAWGLIGLFAGYLASPLRKNRVALLLYGVVSGLLFSLVMDVFTVLWYNESLSASAYMAAMVTALPHTLLYTVSNAAYLLLLAKPLGDKLGRIQIKYGI